MSKAPDLIAKAKEEELEAGEWGEKLAEGIYIINRKKKTLPPEVGSEVHDPALIPDEIKRIQNNLAMLEKSNKELAEALKDDPSEEEYGIAIRENELIMRK
eukprot:Sspe_Gene.34149::Locus_16611_Transcript_1_1_Confidence_1.000_Length_369::g.34149::m.34149